MSRRLARLAVLAALTASAAACSDPPPKPAVAPSVSGDPIAGDPIAGDPIAGAPTAAPPAAPAPAVPVVPPDVAPTPAPPPSEAAGPAPARGLGDVSTPEERGPEDQPTATVPPAPAVPPAPTPPAEPATAGTAPAAPTEPVAPTPPTAPKDPAAAAPTAPPIVPTTASQQPKTDLPAKPADPAAAGAAGAAPADKPAAKSLLPKDRKKGEPVLLDWEQLASFDFTPPPPVYPDPDTGAVPDQTAAIAAARRQIPEEIWELEGQLITVEGFMIPLEYADDGVKSFLISRHAMGCCFGVMPRPHELVECDMGEGKSVPYIGYVPVRITGILHVGLKEGPQTVLTGIYRMDAPKLTVPKEE